LFMCPFFQKNCKDVPECNFKSLEGCLLVPASAAIIKVLANMEILQALIACAIDPDSYNKYWENKNREVKQ